MDIVDFTTLPVNVPAAACIDSFGRKRTHSLDAADSMNISCFTQVSSKKAKRNS